MNKEILHSIVLSLCISAFPCIYAHADEYKELALDAYPGWGDMQIGLSLDGPGNIKIIQFIPGLDKESDYSAGELLLYLQGLWRVGDKKNQAELEMTSMIALGKTEEPKKCSGSLYNITEEQINKIPHFYARFISRCDGDTTYVGALLATQVNRKIAVVIRRLNTSEFNGEAIEEKDGQIMFLNKDGRLYTELQKSEEYLRSVGKD